MSGLHYVSAANSQVLPHCGQDRQSLSFQEQSSSCILHNESIIMHIINLMQTSSPGPTTPQKLFLEWSTILPASTLYVPEHNPVPCQDKPGKYHQLQSVVSVPHMPWFDD